MNGQFALLMNKARAFAAALRRELEEQYPNCKFVYGAGAIEGMSQGQALNWREVATHKFAPNIVLLNPMRHKKDDDTVAREIGDILACDALLIECRWLRRNRLCW